MFRTQAALLCAFLAVAAVTGRPQVFDIGFNPNSQLNQQNGRQNQQNPFLPNANNPVPSSTSAPAVRATTPPPSYYTCLSQCPTTSEYNPVCGSDSVNYHNLGRLQCAARCGTSVQMVRSGTCAPL